MFETERDRGAKSPKKQSYALLFLLAGVAFFASCSGEGDSGDDESEGDAGASSGNGDGTGRFVSCSSDARCDTEHGFSCVLGECRYPCSSHFDCSSVGTCAPLNDEGGALLGTYCELHDPAPSPGGYYTSCPLFNECDTEGGFVCQGAGLGDIDAYCTADCSADDDCPQGFFCDEAERIPCEAACDERGDADNPGCVPSDQIGNDKLEYCGRGGLSRNLCVKQPFCSECESDADCLSLPGGLCARDISGAKICTQACDENTNSCPWGSATICGVWDEERGVATCSHRFGTCRGTGASCEPCVREEDCPGGTCYGSSYTGERWCVNFETTCSCSGLTVRSGVCQGGGCPRTPGEQVMLCLAGENESDPGLCLGAPTTASWTNSLQLGCWGRL
jgi:hypothetical protein